MISFWDDALLAAILGLVWAFAWMLGAAYGRKREGARWRLCAERRVIVFSDGARFHVRAEEDHREWGTR